MLIDKGHGWAASYWRLLPARWVVLVAGESVTEGDRDGRGGSP